MMKPFERIVWHAGEPPAVLQGPPVPLKIGIHEDLVKLATSPATEVRKALRHYCALKPYIAALLVDQAMRYDAAGEPVSGGAQIAAAQLMPAGFTDQVQHLRLSRKASAGVLKPRDFLGVELMAQVRSSMSRVV